jgi:hypothetical protein
MLDLIYILLAIGFFGVMLVYVRALERLGKRSKENSLHEP